MGRYFTLATILLAALFIWSIAAHSSEIVPKTLNLSERVNQCQQDSRCFRSLASDLLKAGDTKTIFGALKVENPDKCHSLAHFLGRQIFKDSSNLVNSFGACSGICQGGCYHGVLEGFLAAEKISYPPSSSELTKLSHSCDQVATDKNTGLYRDCTHGLGHGLMFLLDGELPVVLKLCDELPNPTRCYLGAFMENSSSPTNWSHQSKYIRIEDPLYPCNNLAHKYQAACYTNQSNYFLEFTKFDWFRTTQLCLRVPQDYQGGCFDYLGGNLTYYNQGEGKTLEVCGAVLDPKLKERCFAGAATTLEKLEPGKGKNLCAKAPISLESCMRDNQL